MLYGYARVSTVAQETALQVAALKRYGVKKIIQEQASGSAHRPALEALIERLRPGDTVVVYRADRLSRGLRDFLGLLDTLAAGGVAFKSITEPFDTGTPSGRMVLQLLGVLAEFERGLIRQRCAAGMVEAKARGVRFGRPRSFDYAEAARLRASGLTWPEVARCVGVRSSDTVRIAVCASQSVASMPRR